MKDEMKQVLLSILGGFAIIGFVIFMSSQSQTLDIPDLDGRLCPVNKELENDSHIVFYDFSDPLPKQYQGYPRSLLESVIENEVSQFDHLFIMYFNPKNEVPIQVNDFCIPVVMDDIDEKLRKSIWGRDPGSNSLDSLPPRYKQFLPTIKKLRDNSISLNESIDNSLSELLKKGRKEQKYSLLIENIEEMVGIIKEQGREKATINIFSDMLQNSRSFSHYRKSKSFDVYSNIRKSPYIDMSGMKFNISYLQTCNTYLTKQRKSHRDFWEKYFANSGASVKFSLLTNTKLRCN